MDYRIDGSEIKMNCIDCFYFDKDRSILVIFKYLYLFVWVNCKVILFLCFLNFLGWVGYVVFVIDRLICKVMLI